MQTRLRLTVLTALIITLICGAPLRVPAQIVGPDKLFDEKLKGVLVGFGAGYASALGDSGASTAGFGVAGKLGYGVSDRLAFYLASTPLFGGMFFPDENAPFYLQGAVGGGLSISGGIGYELGHHTAVELGLGVVRGVAVDMVTIGITFNIHLY